MKKTLYLLVVCSIAVISCNSEKVFKSISSHDLKFSSLSLKWDEAIPLGNGMIGALIWEKNDKLRFSLDRIDLWDLRPMQNLSNPEFNFQWVQEQLRNNSYQLVHEAFDLPYDRNPAPSKIPGAALEFDLNGLGDIKSVRLDIQRAICLIEWENGLTLETFVHGMEQTGWYRFTNVPEGFSPKIIPPEYKKASVSKDDGPVTGQDLQRLEYEQGRIEEFENRIVYRQPGWGDFEYEVATAWELDGKILTGVWSVSSTFSENKMNVPAGQLSVSKLNEDTFDGAYEGHYNWWNSFWNKSSVTLPDSLLERQYYLDMYKFGSVARSYTPPISLQAIWTADNGKLPPWKGDYHHDLNTQLSYWPSYIGNHLDLEIGFINWLWENKETFKKYTRTYFGTTGLNVPGVTTIEGKPMGGWIQYSLGPTVASWLGHSFYLHWIYSGDREFLESKAYPWLKQVAIYLDEISIKMDNGVRRLPISSSPEIFHNTAQAWFTSTTNFDLAFIRWNFEKAAELAEELGKKSEARKWKQILSEWPDLSVEYGKGLLIAPGLPYNESHRHFSHLVGWHPLGIIDWSNGEKDQEIILSTLSQLEKFGSDWWTGYSYSWLGNLYARAFMGDKAAEALRIFANCFCLKNSFHVNGDQCKEGHSNFTYRPFTLEGNFAFASAVQEMLIQSHTGVINLFPAIPTDWHTVSFRKLRALDGFLISAKKENDIIETVEIYSESGGNLKMTNPFEGKEFYCDCDYSLSENILNINSMKNENIVMKIMH